MLVITRKKGQRFVIDWGEGCAVVTVTEVQRGACRLGIQASKEVKICREELQKKIEQGRIASSISFSDVKTGERLNVEPLEFEAGS